MMAMIMYSKMIINTGYDYHVDSFDVIMYFSESWVSLMNFVQNMQQKLRKVFAISFIEAATADALTPESHSHNSMKKAFTFSTSRAS